MQVYNLKVPILLIFILLNLAFGFSQNNEEKLDFNLLSENFLRAIKQGKDTKKFQKKLSNTTLELLESQLRTDKQKLAFWVNIYNAYIQVILSENPKLYDNRQAFFNDDRIVIANEKVSFSKIEHGILRKSQWPLGLGKIRKWFPNKFERRLRVNKRDYRIHFALNCGAKDCPPVAIYTADRLYEQFNKSSGLFLKQTTSYEEKSKTVKITPLFSWFRGDFKGRKGSKNILKDQGLIPTTKVKIDFTNYDWTLYLDNWIKL
jgi:hypothetical protein